MYRFRVVQTLPTCDLVLNRKSAESLCSFQNGRFVKISACSSFCAGMDLNVCVKFNTLLLMSSSVTLSDKQKLSGVTFVKQASVKMSKQSDL